MKNLKESFGRNLHNIRKGKKLTVETFAEMVDLSPRQITRIESGDSFPSAETLGKISIALNVKLKDLFDIIWHDDQMYYYNGKVIKPNIRVSKEDDKSYIKSLGPLNDKNLELNETVSFKNAPNYLIEFSKKHKVELVVEVFENKQRDNIVKISPNGQIETIIKKEDLKEDTYYSENSDFDYIMEKTREFSSDKNKISYLKAAIDAISDKKALEKLKSVIKGIELALYK